MYCLDDTIAAIATAPGGARRGIVRVSGPAVHECLNGLFLSEIALPTTGQAQVFSGALQLAHSASSRQLPCELFWWPDARSYTRAPLAELHTIGSPPLLDQVLWQVCRRGARLAQPGEFTLRAFLGGRLDLTQAEAVLGVIDAVDKKQLAVALNQLAGGVSGPLNQLREELLNLLAHLEAGLDFVEEDIEFITRAELLGQLDRAVRTVAELVERMANRAESGDVVQVVLSGCPNVGKSSLFNALVGDRAAIVAPQSGTTRDYLTATIELGGLRCRVVDTAGIETAADPGSLDAVAQEMTHEQNRRADVTVVCIDGSRTLLDWERRQISATPDTLAGVRLLAMTKTDLPQVTPPPANAIATSSTARRGLEELRAAIARAISTAGLGEHLVVAGTAARCRESLDGAAESLRRASELAAGAFGEELVAAELRMALTELGKVVGAVYTEDVLDRVFSRFCIGK